MEETFKDIAYLRRTQPRNEFTLRVCGAYEKLWQQYKLLANAATIEVVERTCKECERRREQVRDRVRRHREAKS